MSGKWAGFTEEDLLSINSEGTKVLEKPVSRVVKSLSNPARQVKKNVIRGRMSSVKTEPKCLGKDKLGAVLLASNSEASLMSLPKESASFSDVALNGNVEEALTNDSTETTSQSLLSESQTTVSTPSPPNCSPNHPPVCIRVKEDRSYEVIGTKKISLEDFQMKQKLMEEQNRHRKELLGRALADRKKRTQEETVRLSHIQEELQKLDSLLSNDVSILRNEIEVASLAFSEAQKRYNKAEKEFLHAKIIMYEKLEQKELLTEHLCTIIEENEMRKARKLSELMDKLEMGVVTEVTPSKSASSSDNSDESCEAEIKETAVELKIDNSQSSNSLKEDAK